MEHYEELQGTLAPYSTYYQDNKKGLFINMDNKKTYLGNLEKQPRKEIHSSLKEKCLNQGYDNSSIFHKHGRFKGNRTTNTNED